MDNINVEEIIERFMSKKASFDDAKLLFIYTAKNSYLNKIIKDNIPHLHTEQIEDLDDIRNIRGAYNKRTNTIYIDNGIVKKTCESKKETSFFELIELYGHELTHHVQYLNNKLKKRHGYSEEQLRLFFRAIKLENKLNERDYFELSVGTYLSLKNEEEAREGGALIALQILKKFTKLETLSEESKSFILTNLKKAKEHQKTYKQFEEPYYDILERTRIFLSLPNEELDESDNLIRYPKILDLLKHMKKASKKEEDLLAQIWVDLRDINSLIADYNYLCQQGEIIIKKKIIERIKELDLDKEKVAELEKELSKLIKTKNAKIK